MNSPGLRVIIVGGSVAGLALAHCLHRAGIDHIVLEKGNEIAPELGASIGIMPNGARILEQLGLFDKIEQRIEPLNNARITHPDNRAVFTSPYPKEIHKRFGFPIAFLTRREFLEITYDSYPEKQKILTNKRVVEVRRLNGGVCVVTDDGSIYDGSLVVGADGVHSRIRSEMWRMADEDLPGHISEKERKSMTAQYACVFGISTGIKGLTNGDQINACSKGIAVMAIHVREGRVFWFIFKKLDEEYRYPAVPRFSTEDAAELCTKLRDVHMYKGLRVDDLWRNREVSSMTALEEGLFKTWFYDRMVLIGDSAHKMTPNFGQGANCAIEDAAALASLLHKLVRVNRSDQPSDLQIQDTLREYQKIRSARMKRIYNDAWRVCRLHTHDGLLYGLIGRYYTPHAGNHPADIASGILADAEKLEFLPLPVRSGPGWAKYSKKGKRGTWEYALGYLLVALVAGASAFLYYQQ